MSEVTKAYPVFDCDAHVVELPEMWEYLSKREQEIVRPWFWPDGNYVVVNGDQQSLAIWGLGHLGVRLGFPSDGRRSVSIVEVSGPGTNKRIIRELFSMLLSDEQCDYCDNAGARDPHARLADMDLQGIDQVMVIPLMMFSAFLFVQDPEAAALMCRAYNDWIHDWCSARPDRLFAAAVVPLLDPQRAAAEVVRAAEQGFKVAMVRPADIQGNYPNKPEFAPLWRAFEDTGLVVAMHSLTPANDHLSTYGKQWSPGLFVDRAVNPRQMPGASQTLAFIHEAMTWLPNVLLSPFFDDYPRITRMAIMESNASWLPSLLEQCDQAVDLFRNECTHPVTMLPSERFAERCFIAFEGDETPVFRQPDVFGDIGIWSSDCYHLDGADAWTAIRAMRACGVPDALQSKLMGENARRMYGIEAKLFTTDEPGSYDRPDWYPRGDDLAPAHGGGSGSSGGTSRRAPG